MTGQPADPAANRRTPIQRAAFVAAVTLLILAVLGLIVPAAMGASFVGVLVAGGCGARDLPAGVDARSIRIPSLEYGARALYVALPPDARGDLPVVVAVPTGNADRGDRAEEWRHYIAAGLAVVSYASNTCAGQPYNGLGGPESDLTDVLAYVASQPSFGSARLDSARVGLHGFSAGGAAALLASIRPPVQPAQVRPPARILAVVAEGNYLDFAHSVAENSRSLGPLGAPFAFGAGLAYRAATGADMSTLTPGDAASRFGPRPILLIYGEGDPALPDARALAARWPHIALWEVPGANHGGYIAAAGDAAYGARVGGFMRDALATGAAAPGA